MLKRFTERIGSWRVHVVIYTSLRTFQQRCRVAHRVQGLYAPAYARTWSLRLLGTIHLPPRPDAGTIAHEAVHAVFDWMKVRHFTAAHVSANEERAARYTAQLVRRILWELACG